MAPTRKSRAHQPSPPSRTLVLDNGAYTIKAGYVAGDVVDEPRVIPNCIARDRKKKTYVASELDKCTDFSEIAFRRPVEKGSVVNWEVEREIWEHEFFEDNAPQRCDPSETRLLLAEPSNSLPVLQTNCDQMVFEEFGFASYYRGIGPSFNAYHDVQGILRTPRDQGTIAQLPAEILMLIDSGYSHTTVTPILQGRPIHPAIRRLDVGGKLLTNYLTRLLSLRHYDMRNETYIVNEMKEAACYVSLDFKGDLERTWKGTRGERREDYLSGSGIAKDYVLPDFHARTKGIVRDYDSVQASRVRKLAAGRAGESSEDVLTLRNERFTVPELLFHPSDIGIRQPGIADLVMQSLRTLPVGLWPGLLCNIIVVGGNTFFEGFVERLQKEIVQLVPDECFVRVARPVDPITSTWLGGATLAKHEHINALSVTKQEYEEYGAAWVARKFSTGLGLES
ncbi:Actin/actin-like protein [Hypoxylon crocopeplum]|nr:Actin/actin-like protein [Hypoxylon crocopeplum]